MPQNLFAIHGVVGLVVAVGEGGTIRHFAGDLYEPREVQSPTGNTLRSVFIESEHSAWAVGDGGTVLHWNGKHWHAMVLASKHTDLLSVYSVGEDLWIGGEHRLILHQPYGVSGMLVTTHTIKSIWGTGQDDLWMLADDAAVLHVDESEEYRMFPVPGLASDRYNAIGGTDAENVYLVGDLGVVARWDGSEWRDLPSTTGDTFTAVCGGDAGDIWATTATGNLWHHDVLGWERAASLPYRLNGVCMVDGMVWACGDRGIVVQHMPEQGDGE